MLKFNRLYITQNIFSTYKEDLNFTDIISNDTLDIAPGNYFELAAYYLLLAINVAVLLMIIRSIYLINKYC